MSGTPRRAPTQGATGLTSRVALRVIGAGNAPAPVHSAKKAATAGTKRGRSEPPAPADHAAAAPAQPRCVAVCAAGCPVRAPRRALPPPPSAPFLPAAPPISPPAGSAAAPAAAAALPAPPAAPAPQQQYILTCVRIKPVEPGQRDGFQEGRGALTIDAAGRHVLEMGEAAGAGAGAPPPPPSSSSALPSASSSAASAAPSSADSTKAFVPDAVFGPDSGQGEVYAACARPLVLGVLAGRNASVIAYGQTGSGKTHTMLGEPSSAAAKGVIPRALEDLFAGAAAAAGGGGGGGPTVTVELFASYVEVHNETVYDLLAGGGAGGGGAPLRMREEGGGDANFFLEGVTRVALTGAAQALEVLATGFAARRTSSTAMNARSSRSHAILSVSAEVRSCAVVAGFERASVRTGVLDIVDLAGSERQRDTGAEGRALKEAGKINNSLGACAVAGRAACCG